MRARTLLLGLSAAVVLTASATAQDFSPYGTGFDFEGFYAGVQGGGYLGASAGGTVGIVAGANFGVTNGVLAGLEFQGGYVQDGSHGFDALALGHVGVQLSESALAYGAIGGGWAAGDGVYALGGGAEFAVTEAFSLRGEGLAVGAWGGGFDRGRFTAGALMHFN